MANEPKLRGVRIKVKVGTQLKGVRIRVKPIATRLNSATLCGGAGGSIIN